MAAAINAGNVPGDDDSLLAILKGPFESNWFKAKDCLLMDAWPIDVEVDHAKAIGLMKQLVALRAKKCAQVQAAVEAGIQQRIAAQAAATKGLDDPLGETGVQDALAAEGEKANDPTRVKDGVVKARQHVMFEQPKGNDKPSSDVDIAMKGDNTELGVEMFNEQFRAMLGVPYEAGVMFDYNVYAQDWIHNLKMDKSNPEKPDFVTKITPGVEHTLPGADEDTKAEVQESRNLVLEQASLLHMRRYMTPAEWQVYGMKRIVSAPPDEQVALSNLLEAVDAQYDEFERLIAAKSTAVQTAIDQAVGAHESAWGEHAAHFDEAATRTGASNRIYEEKLRELKALRIQYKLAAGIQPSTPEAKANMAALATDATRVLSEALFFANEVYATEGAVLHTVMGIQEADKMAKEQGGLKPDVALTDEQYTQSFNENVGDVMKDLGHFEDDPAFAVFRAGKYIDRMLKAAVALTPKATSHKSFAKLAGISTKAVAAKGDAVKGDDPLACRAEFEGFSDEELAALRVEVVMFGAEIPALAQAETPPEVASAKPSEDAAGGDAPKPASAASPLLADVVSASAALPAAVALPEPSGVT